MVSSRKRWATAQSIIDVLLIGPLLSRELRLQLVVLIGDSFSVLEMLEFYFNLLAIALLNRLASLFFYKCSIITITVMCMYVSIESLSRVGVCSLATVLLLHL